MPSVDVHDVAAYILAQKGEMTAMKLQKLVYYSQAWSLVWDEHQLFEQEIHAWINSPVIPALYQTYKGEFLLRKLSKGNPDALNADQKDTVDKVIEFYGDKSSQWLSDLIHQELPWRNARKGLQPFQRGEQVIALDSMAVYYSTLLSAYREEITE